MAEDRKRITVDVDDEGIRDEFSEACRARGTRSNTVLRQFILDQIMAYRRDLEQGLIYRPKPEKATSSKKTSSKKKS